MIDPGGLKCETATVNGAEIRILHRGTMADGGVIWQCIAHPQYEIPRSAQPNSHAEAVQRHYEAICEAGRVPLIIDAGANIGASVLWFSTRYPAAHIVALEPDPDNFRLLTLNSADCDVELRMAGLDGEEGGGVLVDPGRGEWGYQTASAGPGRHITMLSVGGIVAQKLDRPYQPFILKIDIEGAEANVFAKDHARIDPFPVIIVEPHDWMLPGAGSSQSLFRFHADTRREFLFGAENVFSLSWSRLHEPLG